MITHRVRRAFEGVGGRIYQPGEEIDASGFRLLDRLVSQRYLMPIHGIMQIPVPSDVPSPTVEHVALVELETELEHTEAPKAVSGGRRIRVPD